MSAAEGCRLGVIGIGEIEPALGGRDALEIAEKFHPDLVISDISMPKMGRIRRSESLQKKRRPAGPFLLRAAVQRRN